VMNFFENRGLKTKVENNGRVFPLADQSSEVLKALIDYLKESEVQIMTNTAVKKLVLANKRIEKVALADGREIIADKFIICTGGKSYPATGSTGDGYRWLENIGHAITLLSPSLTLIMVKENFVKKLEGLSLKEAEIRLYKDNKKVDSRIGEAIFIADGLSGPVILNLSKKVGQELPGSLEIQIDFFPLLDFVKLDQKLLADFKNGKNKIFKNSLKILLPPKLIPVIVDLSGIDGKKKTALMTREERKKLVNLLKNFSLTIKELKGFDQAMVTAGGVNLREVDPKTMRSKLIDNLYFAGEILDLDGPTGGFNLQIAFSTGWLAGKGK